MRRPTSAVAIACAAAASLALAAPAFAYSCSDIESLQKEARTGDAEAMWHLGLCYFKGNGVAKDVERAFHAWSIAASKGNASAQTNLGVLYENSLKDERRAAELYRQAAQQGQALAQYHLGRMHRDGLGDLPKDEQRAAELFLRAAEQGVPPAKHDLGVMYAYGWGGLPKDERRAVNLFRQAAELGVADSQRTLGVAYSTGMGGLPKDMEKAREWWRKAAAQGDEGAKKFLEQVSSRAQGAKPSGSAGRIALTADSRGHFHGDAYINGSSRSLRFMVDTGATTIALSQAMADILGLDYKSGRRANFSTANGTTQGWTLKLAQVRVGDVTVYDVDAAITPADMDEVLLGNSFLDFFHMERFGGHMVLTRY